MYGTYVVNGVIFHHGIKGQKWGRRRYQNQDGSLTPAGEQRYGDGSGGLSGSSSGQYRSAVQQAKDAKSQAKAAYKQAKQAERNSPEAKAARAEKRKRALKVGATVAATALAAYGAYKANEYVRTKNAQIAAKRGYDVAEKQFTSTVSALTKGPGKLSGQISANSGAKALDYANRSRNDSFGKALKNVVDYRKSEGSLKGLSSLDYYKRARGSSINFG